MSLQDELRSGLDHMKFALNHDFRFFNYRIAFVSGLMQATMIFVVETVNFICIISSMDILSVVMNFMALAVISEFDDAFYAALGEDDPMKELLSAPENFAPLFRITKTTSSNAAEMQGNIRTDDSTQLTKDGKLAANNCIALKWADRSIENKALRCIYQIYRSIYVSIWFYFLPFIALVGSYFAPYYGNALISFYNVLSIANNNSGGFGKNN